MKKNVFFWLWRRISYLPAMFVQLSETNEFLVRDMKEFTDTVKCDTSRLVASTAASMKEQLNIKVLDNRRVCDV